MGRILNFSGADKLERFVGGLKGKKERVFILSDGSRVNNLNGYSIDRLRQVEDTYYSGVQGGNNYIVTYDYVGIGYVINKVEEE